MDAAIVAAVEENFRKAAKEFSFLVEMPFCLDEDRGLWAFGYMPDCGSKNGAVICLWEKGIGCEEIYAWCEKNEVFCSTLNPAPLVGEYNRSYFRELLRDWRIE